MIRAGHTENRKVGDLVLLNTGTREPVEITHLHSGHYDFSFTGKDQNNNIYYFDEDDIYDPNR